MATEPAQVTDDQLDKTKEILGCIIGADHPDLDQWSRQVAQELADRGTVLP